jgi:hypothetical protein
MSRLGNHNRNGQHVNVGRGDVTQALLNYYGDPGIQGGGAYRVRVGDQDVLTSIITRPAMVGFGVSVDTRQLSRCDGCTPCVGNARWDSFRLLPVADRGS